MGCVWDDTIRRKVLEIVHLQTNSQQLRGELRKLSKRIGQLEKTLQEPEISPFHVHATNAQLEQLQNVLKEKEERLVAVDGAHLEELKQWSTKVFLFASKVEYIGVRCHNIEDARAVKCLSLVSKIPMQIFVVKTSPEAPAIKQYAEREQINYRFTDRETSWTDEDKKRGAEIAEEEEKRFRKVLKRDTHWAKKDDDDEDDKMYPPVK